MAVFAASKSPAAPALAMSAEAVTACLAKPVASAAPFFDHLGHLGEKAQIVVLENVDPPEGVEGYCRVEAFTNDPEEGRQGLL